LLDAYHQLGVVPFRMAGLERAFVVGGGYKYLELGEGNCFLRVPEGTTLRPLITGWFAEFADLSGSPAAEVPYPQGPLRFAGSTYDPTAHYRAARVLDFFVEQGLTPDFLRQVSQHQVARLAHEFESLDLDPTLIGRVVSTAIPGLGGFLALRCSQAARLCGALEVRGVFADQRGEIIRFGPAPYLSDRQLCEAMVALGDAVRSLG